MTYQTKHISVSINRSASDVYAFTADPANFPAWVQFIHAIKKQGDLWIAETSLGEIRIKFSPRNEFGIIDHEVILPDGASVYNPMRAIPNHEGCEFIFTLFWMPGRTESEFNEDAQAVNQDLQTLKAIMEQG